MNNKSCIICLCSPTRRNRLAFCFINGIQRWPVDHPLYKDNLGQEQGMVCGSCREQHRDRGDKRVKYDLTVIRRRQGKYVHADHQPPKLERLAVAQREFDQFALRIGLIPRNVVEHIKDDVVREKFEELAELCDTFVDEAREKLQELIELGLVTRDIESICINEHPLKNVSTKWVD